jgi:EAL domain-containing protein (putative c-di-GMP-specific phosphodiesterase class I)
MGMTLQLALPEESLGDAGFLDLLAPCSLITRFQPIVDARSSRGRIWAVECLTRGPEGTPFAQAGALFAEARRRGLEPEIDRACVSAALSTVAQAGVPFDLFLNVHPETLRRDRGFVEFLSAAARRAAVASERLTIEVIEYGRDVVDHALHVALNRLRALGVRIALDDFGVDAANDRLLRTCAFDFAKVDGTLIRGARQSSLTRRRLGALVDRIVASGATVIAEGLEAEADAVAVAGLGIPLAQGHLLGRPVSAEMLALAAPEGPQ